MNIRETLKEMFPDSSLCFLTGLDNAVIGTVSGFDRMPVVAYDYHKVISILIDRDGMSAREAEEFFDFNILGAYFGENTPLFVSTVKGGDIMGAKSKPAKKAKKKKATKKAAAPAMPKM